MRPSYSTITPAVVRRAAQAVLPHALLGKPYGRLVSVPRLLGLVLLTAALRSSLSAVVRRFRFGFGHETARQAVHANLPDHAPPKDWLDELPLRRRLDWLAEVREHKYPEKKVVPLEHPLLCPEGMQL